jgi:hypothetical protein
MELKDFIEIFEIVDLYLDTTNPYDVKDEFIKKLANTFTTIRKSYKALPDARIKDNEDLKKIFLNFEGLVGNIKRMIDKERDSKGDSGFTESVINVQERISELVKTLESLAVISSIIIINQVDLIF